MKVSKKFHFAAAHRLPFHRGLCKNLHGHTYFLEVILKKFYFNDDVLLDFSEFDSIVNCVIVSKCDHALLYCSTDMLLSGLVNSNPELKSFCFDCDTTVENMSSYFARLLADNENLRLAGVDSIVVRLFESEGSYAESKINIK